MQLNNKYAQCLFSSWVIHKVCTLRWGVTNLGQMRAKGFGTLGQKGTSVSPKPRCHQAKAMVVERIKQK